MAGRRRQQQSALWKFHGIGGARPACPSRSHACQAAGAQFWVNVESGQAEVDNWEDFLQAERERRVPWQFTPMPWLEKKLRLAARYGEGIVNWGYFPYMDPLPPRGTASPAQRKAYAAYKAYFDRVRGPTSPD